MSQKVIESGVTILIAIIGVAVISVLVSRQSNTAGVITAGAGGLGQALACAISPITGSGACNSVTTSVTSIFRPMGA